MQSEWIATGILLVAILMWCRARASERAALAHYSGSTRLRIYLPLIPWHDAVAPNDHAVLRSVRIRANIAAPALITIALIASLNADVPEPAISSAQPHLDVDEAETTATPMPSIEVVAIPARPEPGVEPEPEQEPEREPETLEELRSPTRLYGTAKIKPVYRLHDVEGARITHIDPNSFWAMLGVREGDVVIELHGEPVDNPTALVALMNILERDEHVALAVRGTDGEVRYLEFRVPDDS
jgi:hypothetical protein